MHCIDPVFLLDLNEYEKLINESDVTLPNNDYLCFYTLTIPNETYNFFLSIVKSLSEIFYQKRGKYSSFSIKIITFVVIKSSNHGLEKRNNTTRKWCIS